MKEYKELLRQWFIVKILNASIVFVGAIILCVVGFMKEMFIELIAAEISLFVVWFLTDKIFDMLRPMPPIMMIPMPKENKDETTRDL